ncbi:MAG TPA: hypothetical protein VGK19_19930 [Capsulimonadaceae bacterium]|jgi:hypothetical protein
MKKYLTLAIALTVALSAIVAHAGPTHKKTGTSAKPMACKVCKMTGKKAATCPIVMSDDRTTATDVFLGGTEFIRYRNSAAGYTATQRATETQERLNLILGLGPIKPSDIKAVQTKSAAVVTVKGHLLYTADPATACVNKTTPIELAKDWATATRSLLPGLTVAK